MSRTTRSHSAALRLALVAAGLTAAPAAAQLDATRFVPVDEVRPGMVGEGYSVFSGNGQEAFSVRVIDVIKNHGPKHDLILVELDGDVVNEAGIIQGMSGSPVYVDGRLLGAVAYGWAFSKRPIAGITPIGEMLAVMDAPEPEQELAARPPDGAAGVPNEALRNLMAKDPGDASSLAPLRAPVAVSGLSALGMESLSKGLGPLGLSVVQGTGGGTGAGTVETPLRGGDPVSIPLVRGDASIAVFGTVTYSDAERLVAFGHPVFHRDGQRLPMAGARVLGVLPSQMQSFKFSSAGDPIGYFYSDQSPGAAGRYGDPPPMLPVEIAVEYLGETMRFSYDVARDRQFTPLLVQAVAVSTITTKLHQSGYGTLDTEVRVHLADGTVIRHRDLLATASPPEVLGFLSASPIAALVANPYAEPNLERIEIETKIDREVRISGIENVKVLTPSIHPGDRIDLELTLRPYRGELRTVMTSLDVPASAPIGPVVLRVCDRVTFDELDRERAPDKYRPRSYAQFVDQLERLPSHNQVILRLYAPGNALVVEGAELRSLPPSVRHALGKVSVSGKRSTAEGVEVATKIVELEEHVLGCHTIAIELEER